MKVVITGATGFIGKALCQKLGCNYEIVALSQNPEKAKRTLGNSIKAVQWDGKKIDNWTHELDGAFCVINLAGENIGTGRWTKAKKQKIRQSRLDVTAAIVEAIRNTKNKPKVLVQASAIGWYGSKGRIIADETSEKGNGFLATLCHDWEKLTEPVPNMGIRCVTVRLGMVLGTQAGALPNLMKPFRFFLGGYIGSGQQWLSWISIDDVIEAIRFLIENENCIGIYNLTAAEPIQLKDFCRILGKQMKRPCWTVIPSFAARLLFGQMAEELLLASYKITPKRLIESEYKFKYKQVDDFLSSMFHKD